MFNRKGQAALEFLTTYGWAFLVILVMIGALGYFGVLNPQNFIPEDCQLAGQISCLAGTLTVERAGFKLQNNLPETITVISVVLEDPRDEIIGWNLLDTYNLTLGPSAKGNVNLTDHGLGGAPSYELPLGEKLKLNLKVRWYKNGVGPDFPQIATGTLIATIQ